MTADLFRDFLSDKGADLRFPAPPYVVEEFSLSIISNYGNRIGAGKLFLVTMYSLFSTFSL